jgi:hypothetical protein
MRLQAAEVEAVMWIAAADLQAALVRRDPAFVSVGTPASYAELFRRLEDYRMAKATR